MKRIIFLLILVVNVKLYAEKGSIDTVYYFKLGNLKQQDSINPYYPQNIFGLPSRKATRTVPESSQSEILSIGIGGEIIVGFKNKILKNGDGVDFIIFENAFVNNINNGIFAEPAVVSVSKDGINFIEFPFDKDSLIGLAGITPTNGSVDAYKYPQSGGDGFDLSVIGLDYIKYIKIKDTTLHITKLDKSNKFYNPEFLLSGFDLDAVLGLYLEDETVNVEDNNNYLEITYNEHSKSLFINNLYNELINLKIVNLNGQVIYNNTIFNNITIDLNDLLSGIYFITCYNESHSSIKKIIITN